MRCNSAVNIHVRLLVQTVSYTCAVFTFSCLNRVKSDGGSKFSAAFCDILDVRVYGSAYLKTGGNDFCNCYPSHSYRFKCITIIDMCEIFTLL